MPVAGGEGKMAAASCISYCLSSSGSASVGSILARACFEMDVTMGSLSGAVFELAVVVSVVYLEVSVAPAGDLLHAGMTGDA